MRKLYLATFIATLIVPISVQAENNILFILDGSNSMWGQIDGEAKINIAQDVLGSLLTDLPGDTNVGLMSYGQRDKTSCTDIELLSPIGADKTDALVEKIKGIQPKGKTPIAAALEDSVNAFASREGENNHVVLISDGLESCDGDPCAAAGMLATANIKARVHVVGFDIGDEEREKLECISKMGNGIYLNASNATELKDAVAEVKKEAVKPSAPVAKEYFRDDFDGEDLADHWEVLNPNPDTFIVEDGKLVVISAVANNITDEKGENTFRLTKAMPDGDWDAVVKLVPEIQTIQERMSLSYMKDGKNRLTAIMDITVIKYADGTAQMILRGQKHSKGEVTAFDLVVMQQKYLKSGAQRLNWFKNNARAIYLKIAKRGRSYVVSTKIEGDATTKDGKKPEWVSVQKLTSLRPPGTNLVLAFPQLVETNGESIIAVDWVKITAISND